MPQDVPQDILAVIQAEAAKPEFYEYARNVLVELCKVDNTPNSDVAVMKENEDQAYGIIRREVAAIMGDAVQVEFRPILAKIKDHLFYTQPHYTKTADRPEGLSVEETYAGRGNLIATLHGKNPDGEGKSMALNAHIDVVAPYFPPQVDGDVVSGRGSADDKASIVAMLLQMRLLKCVMDRCGIAPNQEVMYQFVTDEEPGGNGSLSIALDDDIQFDCVVVGEITDNLVHPANRGAVWYKAVVDTLGNDALNAVEMAASIVLSMEDEGAAIKSESEHPLFPTRPVQTNHGVLGGFGEHPSSVNDLIVLDVAVEDKAAAKQVVDAAVAAYVERYGDKTQEADPDTGEPKVKVHVEVADTDAGIRVKVNGKAGHMGAILECDNSITKAAYIVKGFMDRRGLGAKISLGQPSAPCTAKLVMEGGQGFVPTHDITEVMGRIAGSAVAGAKAYCESMGVAFDEGMVAVTYEKLHNDSFERDVDGPAMQAAIAACKAVGIWRDEPIVGWTVSCDARIFAKIHPDREVLTFGAGLLSAAHSADEQVKVSEILKAAQMQTVLALSYCGYA